MKKIPFFIAATVITLAFAGCGTTKPVVQEVVKRDTVIAEVVQAPVVKTYHVDAHPEVISIAEAVALLGNKGEASAIAKKYKYKTVSPYGIYRLDRYDTMLYKNCTLPRSYGKEMYEDAPKPQAKGTSSYVAISTSVVIAVFNNTAYGNLVEQVKGLGYSLVETGHEERYSNGTTDIYCYAGGKRVRIEKAMP